MFFAAAVAVILWEDECCLPPKRLLLCNQGVRKEILLKADMGLLGNER
jgi:hypothetical protein